MKKIKRFFRKAVKEIEFYRLKLMNTDPNFKRTKVAALFVAVIVEISIGFAYLPAAIAIAGMCIAIVIFRGAKKAIKSEMILRKYRGNKTKTNFRLG